METEYTDYFLYLFVEKKRDMDFFQLRRFCGAEVPTGDH